MKKHGTSLSYSFQNFWKLQTCLKTTKSFLSLLEISSKLLEYSRLTDWIFPAYYLDTPKTYLIPPVWHTDKEYFCHRMDIRGWKVHVRECLERYINSYLPSAYLYCLRTNCIIQDYIRSPASMNQSSYFCYNSLLAVNTCWLMFIIQSNGLIWCRKVNFDYQVYIVFPISS